MASKDRISFLNPFLEKKSICVLGRQEADSCIVFSVEATTLVCRRRRCRRRSFSIYWL